MAVYIALGLFEAHNLLLVIVVYLAFKSIRKAVGGPSNEIDESLRLREKTYILVGAFHGPGLELFKSLASRGAQIIALQPQITPEIMQLLILLRSTTSNDRIYAEECDILSLESCFNFAQQWKKDARRGTMDELEARIDGIVFCDSGLEKVPVGLEIQFNKETKTELQHSSIITSRLWLLHILQAALEKSALVSEVRVVHLISPFYPASPKLSWSSSQELDLDYKTRVYPRYSPWRAESLATLVLLLLTPTLNQEFNKSLPFTSKGIFNITVTGGITRANFKKFLVKDSNFSLGALAYWFLFPALLLFTRTSEQVSRGLEWALLGDMSLETPVPKLVTPGVLYKDQEIVKILAFEGLKAPDLIAREALDEELKPIKGLVAQLTLKAKASKKEL